MTARPSTGIWLARTLADDAPSLAPDSPCGDALEIFNAAPDIFGLAVVRNGVPRGLISRIPLMTTFAQPIMRDLYERRPVSLLMDRKPLIVDGDTTITELAGLIYKLTPTAMINGFIVTDSGRYVGIGSGLELLRRMTEQSEHRNQELKEAMRQAIDASAAKSQFLAHMSHELRTPLNAVIGFAEMIGTELLGPIGHSKYLEYARDIHDSASHLLSLINDILDLSKAEAGKFELQLDATDLATTIRECLRLFTMRAHEAGLALECRIADSLPPALADARKLRQIVINLLSNAIKFTPEHGNVTVELHRNASGAFQISITDTGIGMGPDDIAKALSPFGQIDNSMTRKYPGTGLGLPLTKALVELHGGTLRIASTPGVGTTLLITLPLALAEPLAQPPVRVAQH